MLFRPALLGAIISSTSFAATINPPRVSLRDLANGHEGQATAQHDFWKAIQHYGFCSLTNVFPAGEKSTLLQQFQACMDSLGDDSNEANLHVFEDGTHRKTFATRAVFEAPSSRFHPAIVSGASVACQEFEVASQGFRQRVDRVSQVIASQLDARNSLDATDSLVLGEEYSSMQDVVFHGDHLEHFHSYEKHMESGGSTVTMDWHKDQGLFLLFTPGQLISQGGIPSQDFYVKVDGQANLVQFDGSDDLVLLLGDGVGQLGMDLEAPWHSVSVESNTKDRVWYGRMVLPPADLLHPDSGLPYGEIRQLLNQNSAGSISCSSSSTTARHLQESECNLESELLCWHQCMPMADFGVNETLCKAQNLDLACINPQNEVWDGNHADKDAGYGPGCVDLSTAVIANQKTETDDGDEKADGDEDTDGEDDGHDHDSHSKSNAFIKSTTMLASALSLVTLWRMG